MQNNNNYPKHPMSSRSHKKFRPYIFFLVILSAFFSKTLTMYILYVNCYRRNTRPTCNGLQTSFKTRKRLDYLQLRIWLKIEQNKQLFTPFKDRKN